MRRGDEGEAGGRTSRESPASSSGEMGDWKSNACYSTHTQVKRLLLHTHPSQTPVTPHTPKSNACYSTHTSQTPVTPHTHKSNACYSTHTQVKRLLLHTHPSQTPVTPHTHKSNASYSLTHTSHMPASKSKGWPPSSAHTHTINASASTEWHW